MSELMLLDLASYIHSEAELLQLGLRLGVDPNTLHSHIYDHKHSITVTTYRILVTWFESVRKSEAYHILEGALRSAGKTQAVLELMETWEEPDFGGQDSLL